MAVTVEPHKKGTIYSISLYSHIVCIVPNYELNHAHTVDFFNVIHPFSKSKKG